MYLVGGARSVETEREDSIIAKTRSTSKGSTHRFGGDWTDAKLDVLAKYLKSYTTALEGKPTPEQPFRKAYIDAFAGTGTRTARESESSGASETLLFPDLAEAAPQKLLDGSAKLALQLEPRFDKYIFIERSPERCQQLEALKTEFPALKDDIDVRQCEANEVIQKLCVDPSKWKSRRAVLFLDPYGHAGRVEDHRGGRRDEGDRPVAPRAARHGHEPPRAEVRQAARVVAPAHERLPRHGRLV